MSMDLHCEFRREWRYSCIVKNFAINNTKTIRIHGDHAKGRSNRDVEEVIFGKINLREFPRGIGTAFPSLKKLVLENCAIERISRDDFVDLGNLKFLFLGQNRITELQRDVFIHLKGLFHLDLIKNKIKFIHPGAIESLFKLQHLDLRENDNINKKFDILLSDEKSRVKMIEEVTFLCNPI